MRYWTLTQIGKKIGSDIIAPKGDRTKIVQYLYNVKSASTDEIAMHCGIPSARIGTMLSLMARKGIVKELSNG